MKYRSDIDGLRALAVLPVIFFHAGYQAFSGGFVGVDVFFVISGYLIGSIVITELREGSFSFAHFYERRARRILPALFLVMLVTLPLAWELLLPVDIRRYAQSLVAVPLFGANFLFWRTSGYFDVASEFKPLLHTWSLSVEEQYYLLFPFLMVVLWRVARRSLAGALAGATVLSFGLAEWMSVGQAKAAYFLLPTRAWELLAGCLAALHMSQRAEGPIRSWAFDAAATLGLCLIAYAIFCFDMRTPYPGLYALAPVVGAVLVIVFSSARGLVGRLLGHRCLVGLGCVSYSAYLWHQPIFSFTRHRSGLALDPWVMPALIFLTWVLAVFSWRFVERPFRNPAVVGRRSLLLFSVAGGLLFVVIGMAGQWTRRFATLKPLVTVYPGDVGHTQIKQYNASRFYRCTPEALAADAPTAEGYVRCLQSRIDREVDMVLLGDSHAEHLFLGMAELLRDRNIVYFVKGRHPFLRGPEYEEIFRHVLRTPSIKTVVYSMRWADRQKDIRSDSNLKQELTETIHAFQSAGKRVYLLDDVPSFPISAEKCKFVSSPYQVPNCAVRKSFVTDYEAAYSPVLKEVAQRLSVDYWPLRDQFCTDTECSMVVDKTLMYRDGNHLNINGSRFIGAQIVRQFPEMRVTPQ